MDREKFEYWFSVLLNKLTSGRSALESLVNATVNMASVFGIEPARCEHGIAAWCGACNRERKEAAKANGMEGGEA